MFFLSRLKQPLQMSGTVMLADVLTVHVNNAWIHKQWCTLNCSPGVLITHCVCVCDFCMSADRERSSTAQRKSVVLSVVCVCTCVWAAWVAALLWEGLQYWWYMTVQISSLHPQRNQKDVPHLSAHLLQIVIYDTWTNTQYYTNEFHHFFPLFSQTWKRIISIGQAE